MDRNAMLGQAVQELVAIPEENLGLACDLLAKFGTNSRHLREAPKFLRGEPCFMPGKINLSRLLFIEGATAVIPAIGPTRRNPFATKGEDPKSPFGFSNLLVSLAPSRKTKATTIQGHKLLVQMNVEELIEAAGGEDEVRKKYLLTPEQIRAVVDVQASGSSDGPLRVDGWAELFFTLAANKDIGLVGASWRSADRFWGVWSGPRSSSGRWCAGGRLFLGT